MPDFTFSSPDGKSYTVSGPEGATAEQAFGMLQKQIGSPAGPKGIVANAADIAKSAPRAALQGLSDVLSAGGQAAQIEMGQPVDVPSSEDTTKILEKNITGDLHQPEGRAAKITSAGVRALANPVSFLGPGGLPLKIGGALLSGAGGEAGRQAAEGTKYETPAQIGGSLLGGVVGAKALGPAAERAVVPKYRELKDAATSDYQAARNSGLELHPQGVAQFAAKAERELTGANHGFTGGQYGDAPKTLAVLDTLQKPPAGAVVTASNVDAIRKNLGRLSRETHEGKPTPDAAAASVALGELNQYLEAIPANHILAGDAAKYLSATKQGNANYAAAQRVRRIEQRLTNATDATEGSIAAKIDNQIKSKLRSGYLTSEEKQLGLTPEEVAAIRHVNRGSVTERMLRQLGRLAPEGPMNLALHVGTGLGAATVTGGTSVPIQIAGALAASAAKHGAQRMTKSNAANVAQMLAKRSPEYEARASRVRPTDNSPHVAAIARALATGAMR